MNLRPNLYDYLKIIALLTMIVDHVGFFLYPEIEILRIVGRIAFPLFLFLVGWNHSYQRRPGLRYLWIILQLLMRGAVRWWVRAFYSPLNILLAIGTTRVLLWWLLKQKSQVLERLVMLIALIFATQSQGVVDYGTLSVVFALLGYRVRSWWRSLRSTGIILGWVLFHLVFMFEYQWYWVEWVPWLIWIGIFLSTSMIWMSKDNTVMITKLWVDRLLLWVSKNALILYVLQGVVLWVRATLI